MFLKNNKQTRKQAFISWKKNKIKKIQNMYWVPFLVRILDSTVFTQPQKEKLI